MTSPAQLKYLDAIGIPVWVSRERIIQTQSIALKIDDSDCVGSAEDILHDLETKLNKPIKKDFKIESASVTTELGRVKKVQSTPVVNSKNTAKTVSEIGRTENHIVYACGNLNADWLIIGESPEINEARESQPFAGESGVLLSNMLRAVGLEYPRKEAYLVNVLKSTFSEVHHKDEDSQDALNLLLNKIIEAVNPKIIFIVGQLAAQNLLLSKEPLARLRAKEQFLVGSKIPVVVSYYPSYLLSKPLDKRKAWDDLKRAMKAVHEP